MYKVNGNEEAKYVEVLKIDYKPNKYIIFSLLLFRNIDGNDIMIRIVCAISLNHNI